MVPMEDHKPSFYRRLPCHNYFTHNLIAALLDNHIHRGNELNIDPKKNRLEKSTRYE